MTRVCRPGSAASRSTGLSSFVLSKRTWVLLSTSSCMSLNICYRSLLIAFFTRSSTLSLHVILGGDLLDTNLWPSSSS